MGLDIRWPIGIMFSLISLLLIIEGALNGPSDKSLGLNIDLWWGIILLVFGLFMLLGAWRGKKNLPNG
jgi:hypothetical protein